YVWNVIGRNANVEAGIKLGRDLFLRHLALQFAYRAVEHLGVEFESDRFDVPALLAAQQVSCTAQLQIKCGDLEPRAQVGEFLQRSQPPPRNRRQLDFRRQQQVRIRPPIRAPDAATQL